MRQLPLNNLWRRLDAAFIEFGEKEIPFLFSKLEQEHAASAGTCALFDLSWKDHLTVTGKDRIEVLHSLFTNDVKGMKIGAGGCGAFLTAQGKVIGIFEMLMADDHILIECESGLGPKLAAALNKFIIMEDAAIENITGRFARLSIEGPAAPELLQNMGLPDPGTTILSHAAVSLGGEQIRLTKETAGYGLFIQRDGAEKIAESLLDAGKRFGLKPAGLKAWEIRRIEKGFLRWGIDITEEETLPETGLDAVCASETKGCYPGQEVVARTNTYKGHAKKMAALEIVGEKLPAAGAMLFAAGAPAGKITSSTHSIESKKGLAFAYILKNAFTAASLNGEGWTAAVVSRPLRPG